MHLRRLWIPIAASLLVAGSFLVLAVLPAPTNLLKARLWFTVEDLSLQPTSIEGQEGTFLAATIQYENRGPVSAELDLVLVTVLSEENGITFDTNSDWSLFMESGDVRSVTFSGPVFGSWDSAVFWVEVSSHSLLGSQRTADYFRVDSPLAVEV